MNVSGAHMDEIAQAIYDVGLVYPGVHVCESTLNDFMQGLAEEQAKYQADHRQQGHQNFQDRFDRVQAELKMVATEICAESWPWEADYPLDKVATSMYKAWSQSSGHWRVASTKHRLFGCYMARGKNNIWYATIIVAD